MKALPANVSTSPLTSFGAVVESSLQPENQKLKPASLDQQDHVYRSMLDALDRHQIEKEMKASFSPF